MKSLEVKDKTELSFKIDDIIFSIQPPDETEDEASLNIALPSEEIEYDLSFAEAREFHRKLGVLIGVEK